MRLQFLAIPLLALAMTALADTTITYQGQLDQDGQSFTGTVDMEFELFDGGPDDNPSSVAGPIAVPNVPVSDGLFQVELDFGDAPYEQGLFLQVTVDGDELSPLQLVTAAPLAVRTLEEGSAWTRLGQNIQREEGRVMVGPTSTFAKMAIQTDPSVTIALNVANADGDQVLRVNGATNGTGNSSVVIGSGQSFGPENGLHVRGETHLRDNVLVGNPLGVTTVEQFRVLGNDADFTAGDAVAGGFAAIAHKPGANTAFLAGPEGSQSAFFIGDPVVLGSNTDFRMSGEATISGSGNLSVGDPAFNPGPGGIRAEGIIVAEGDFLATFGELQMATDSMPGGSATVCRSTTGNFQVLGFCSSSARYKQNVKPLDSAASLVSQLRAVSFRWADSGEEDFGLIAEEVAAVEPRLATFDEYGEVKGVKYRHLAAVLVRALQEQQAQTQAELARRDAEIAALRNELEDRGLETAERLAALEAMLLDGAELAGAR